MPFQVSYLVFTYVATEKKTKRGRVSPGKRHKRLAIGQMMASGGLTVKVLGY